MRPGIAFAQDGQGNIVRARLMGAPEQCLELELPLTDVSGWCVLPWPHDGVPHIFTQWGRV